MWSPPLAAADGSPELVIVEGVAAVEVANTPVDQQDRLPFAPSGHVEVIPEESIGTGLSADRILAAGHQQDRLADLRHRRNGSPARRGLPVSRTPRGANRHGLRGGLPLGIAVDLATDTVYVDSIIDSSTDVFDGATCNATHHSGGGQTPVSVPMGGWPSNVAVNPVTGTVYAPDNVDGEVSFFGHPVH